MEFQPDSNNYTYVLPEENLPTFCKHFQNIYQFDKFEYNYTWTFNSKKKKKNENGIVFKYFKVHKFDFFQGTFLIG